MAEVTMPRLSDTMEEGTIASWLKKPGEQVNKGDVIAQIETDKATMDLTAFEAGTLQEILAPEGSTVAIGEPVARIGSGPAGDAKAAPAEANERPAEAKERPAEAKEPPAEAKEPSADAKEPSHEAKAPPAEKAATPPAAEETGSETPQTEEARENVSEAAEPTESPARQEQRPTTTDTTEAPAQPRQRQTPSGPTEPSEAPAQGAEAADGKVRASPMARHIAAEHGLDISRISGSGPQGRVIRADVEAALSAPGGAEAPSAPSAEAQPSAEARQPSAEAQPAAAPAGADDERVNLSQMRRTIARRMAESTRTIPHFFLTTTVDASEMASLRKQINAQLPEDGVKITFNDMVVKGAAIAIRKVPEVNVSFADDSLIRHKRVHIGVAVATERGLIVPVIRDVDQKSIGQVGRETRDLAERANSGKLQPTEYSGGTFTVSNLGMFGVEQFNAVINPPEAAILAVGAILREPTELNGQVVLRERMKLTLSVDHRALDGAIGARYLQALKAILEKPMQLLV
jgi:pyruvate dehydrogenase E2 component (dihydrolipoamide acetyltransferase)